MGRHRETRELRPAWLLYQVTLDKFLKVHEQTPAHTLTVPVSEPPFAHL